MLFCKLFSLLEVLGGEQRKLREAKVLRHGCTAQKDGSRIMYPAVSLFNPVKDDAWPKIRLETAAESQSKLGVG
jgi:hypothetical protein